MIIDSSSMNLASSQELVKKYEKSEELTAWVRGAGSDERKEPERGDDRVSISRKAMGHLAKHLDKIIARLEKDLDRAERHPEKGLEKAMKHLEKGLEKAEKHLERDLDKAAKHLRVDDDMDSEGVRRISVGRHEANKLGFIKNMIEAFTGREIKLSDMEEWSRRIGEEDDHDDDHSDEGARAGESGRWGMVYNSHESYYEREQMSFNAGGVVRTADGREINFSLDLMMSREFLSETSISLAAGGVLPGSLEVDFAGPASELSDSRFNFGAPGDDSNTISYLALGSGLLSLDLNNDGQVDGLNELFGPSTGNGFEELAAYDEDGNGWIDEADSVYDRLQIWSQGSEGEAVLSGLEDNNVGAINLGNVDSPFSLKNNSNTLIGQIEKSGVYLQEDGTPGTIQQLSIVA